MRCGFRGKVEGDPRQRVDSILRPSGGALYPPLVFPSLPLHVFFFPPQLSLPLPVPLGGGVLIHESGWGRVGEDGSPERNEHSLGALPVHASREGTTFDGEDAREPYPPFRMWFSCIRLERSMNPHQPVGVVRHHCPTVRRP